MQQRNRYPKIHYPIFRLDLVIQGMGVHGSDQAEDTGQHNVHWDDDKVTKTLLCVVRPDLCRNILTLNRHLDKDLVLFLVYNTTLSYFGM